MEKVQQGNLIQNDKSSLQLKNNNNNGNNLMSTLMSGVLGKKPPNDNDLFKSERPKNDDDIESIETKLTEYYKRTNDNFTRENNIYTKRDFNIPEKKMTNELIILSNDKLDREKKMQEYQEQLKSDMEIHKKNMAKDEEKIRRYYQRRTITNNNYKILIISLTIIICILLLSLLYLFFEK